MALRALGSLLNRTLKRHGIADDVSAALVVETFEKILAERWGGAAQAGITIRYYKNNSVYVSCRSSVLAQELRIHEKSLLAALNNRIGSRLKIDTIRFVA